MSQKPIICITKLPRYHYFQWFLLGFYELQKRKKIKLKFKIPFFIRITTIISNEFFCLFIRKLINTKFHYKDSYNLEGYVEFKGYKSYFCIDSADAPYLFNDKDLNFVDTYFKMQYPKSINEDYFMLNHIKIPWSDHEHNNPQYENLTALASRKVISNFAQKRNKIFPLMIGVRKLSESNSYHALKKNFNRIRSYKNNSKTMNYFGYFGSAQGPEPRPSFDGIIDYDGESSIVYYLKDEISHPNEKRKIICDLLNGIEKSEFTVISKHADTKTSKIEKKKIINLKNFHQHLSKFKFNINVSGYRLSIPNRFMDSFLVNTKIVTDKLFVKWYLPFDDEVFETIEMGYLKNSLVDWDKAISDIKNLDFDSYKINEAFEKKWAPKVVVEYILKTLLRNFNE